MESHYMIHYKVGIINQYIQIFMNISYVKKQISFFISNIKTEMRVIVILCF